MLDHLPPKGYGSRTRLTVHHARGRTRAWPVPGASTRIEAAL